MIGGQRSRGDVARLWGGGAKSLPYPELEPGLYDSTNVEGKEIFSVKETTAGYQGPTDYIYYTKSLQPDKDLGPTRIIDNTRSEPDRIHGKNFVNEEPSAAPRSSGVSIPSDRLRSEKNGLREVIDRSKNKGRTQPSKTTDANGSSKKEGDRVLVPVKEVTQITRPVDGGEPFIESVGVDENGTMKVPPSIPGRVSKEASDAVRGENQVEAPAEIPEKTPAETIEEIQKETQVEAPAEIPESTSVEIIEQVQNETPAEVEEEPAAAVVPVLPDRIDEAVAEEIADSTQKPDGLREIPEVNTETSTEITADDSAEAPVGITEDEPAEAVAPVYENIEESAEAPSGTAEAEEKKTPSLPGISNVTPDPLDPSTSTHTTDELTPNIPVVDESPTSWDEEDRFRNLSAPLIDMRARRRMKYVNGVLFSSQSVPDAPAETESKKVEIKSETFTFEQTESVPESTEPSLSDLVRPATRRLMLVPLEIRDEVADVMRIVVPGIALEDFGGEDLSEIPDDGIEAMCAEPAIEVKQQLVLSFGGCGVSEDCVRFMFGSP